MAPSSFERLPDALLCLIVGKCTLEQDLARLSRTCKRLCCLVGGAPSLLCLAVNNQAHPSTPTAQVRASQPITLCLGFHEVRELRKVPASRAFQQVEELAIGVDEDDLRAGCWEALARFLTSSVQRWKHLKDVGIIGQEYLLEEG
jgi:hypothetical protein